ncbi:MAG: hypothetical protein A3K05_00160 [Candidatus Doudnabacteria bacterium RIFCSPHIGHO2_01_48_18]|nr:MAG: hypothetical protein A3K05_00160 [Candidatus Doudnabacteria bacterium RIFCSPHIGHO2_01_48_18]
MSGSGFLLDYFFALLICGGTLGIPALLFARSKSGAGKRVGLLSEKKNRTAPGRANSPGQLLKLVLVLAVLFLAKPAFHM